MKKCFLGLCLLAISITFYGQENDPEFDLTTHNISSDEVQTKYLTRYTHSIINIEADGEQGQGVVVARDLVITSLSLVCNKSSIYYRDASGARKYFDGYLAADFERGIVLLKTSSPHSVFINPGHTSLHPTIRSYVSDLYFMHKNGNRFSIDKAGLAKDAGGNKSPHLIRKLEYNGAQAIPGYIVFDKYMMWGGMITYIDGKPHHVNNITLLELYLFKDLAPMNLSGLYYPQAEEESKKKQKPVIYKVGLVDERKSGNGKSTFDILSLDYIKREQEKLDFYFTFKSNSWMRGIEFKPSLTLVDIKTGFLYHPVPNAFPSNYVYNNTSYRTCISFEHIPTSVNHVKVQNFPADLYSYESEIRNQQTISARKFFDDVIINNFPVTSKTHYNLDEGSGNEGTVAFYALKNSSNLNDNVRIYIDGQEAGIISKYSDESKSEFCGSPAAVTVRLKAGEYTYKAVMGKKKLERKLMIRKGICNPQLIKF